MNSVRIRLFNFLLCLSKAQDLINPQLTNHQQQVAYLSFRLAEKLNLSEEETRKTFFAALVHDIGALASKERLELVENESVDSINHAFRGAKLLEKLRPMRDEAIIIKYHHFPWKNGTQTTHQGEIIPFSSHIIHLADRVCAKIRATRHVLTQVHEIMDDIEQKAGEVFAPLCVEAMCALAAKEYIWLDITSDSPAERIPRNLFNTISINTQDMTQLALIFSHVIDFRSRFTSRHSSGVAVTAQRLAELAGFSPSECTMMLIAGYLHDLGKLAVDNQILEKDTVLTTEEFNHVRTHTYYTYYLLNDMPELKTIQTWAAYHHERLSGKGYPFHIRGEDLSLGSRIMGVADIFTAITENRPYRKGMEAAHAEKVLKNMVANHSIDGRITALLLDNFEEINRLRAQAQKEAEEYYDSFFGE